MRLRAILFAVVMLAGVGYSAVTLARMATDWIEATTEQRLAEGLDAAGQHWASATVDGLAVSLAGAAPDETSRFRALEAARGIVDEGRITDTTTLDAAALAAPPAFALELLRNDAEVSLIGLVPEAGGRDVIRAALRAGGLTGNVADMLESVSDPAPGGWREALGYGLALLGELPRAKISVAPGRVGVISVAESEAERSALDARLRAAAPDGVALALDISAPRPAITPFAFDFRLADGAGTLAACSAESDAAAAAILAAARGAGLAGDAGCAVGLGAPSPDWRAAIEQGLRAVAGLGGGRIALRDFDAELAPPAGTPPERQAEAVRALEAGLPAGFRLATVAAPPAAAAAGDAPAAEPRFEAVLLLDGNVRLAGPVQDQTSQAAIESFAAALFGHERVVDGTVLDPALPEGWPVRVLAGVEALSALEEGRLEVTASRVSVEGWGLDEHVEQRVRDLLAGKVGQDAQVDVTFNAEAAAAAALAARPRPEICADQINAILESDSIRFAAGSAEIVPESAGMIAAIADVLRGCPGAEFEIAGHTDGQGPEAVNRQLSEDRAAAVAAALQAEDLPLVTLVAHGYGASRPIADNATADGRARNRRIEFNPGPFPEAAPDEPEPERVASSAGSADCVAGAEAILAERTLDFEAGSAELTEASAPVIAAIGSALAACAGATIEVGGHTDSQGSDSGNQRLSEQRAEAVLAALQASAGPDALPGMVARGYGEAGPVADNATAEGRAKNRRIAFRALDLPDADLPPQAAVEAGAGAEADCLARAKVILAEGSIEFEPGSATIASASDAVVAALREAMRACPDATLEVGGYTDSEGSESGNLRLSQRRAEAVLAAIRAEDLPLAAMTARGYGEADPVADNDTAEGRARNRRIALAPAEVGSDDGSE